MKCHLEYFITAIIIVFGLAIITQYHPSLYHRASHIQVALIQKQLKTAVSTM